MKQFKKSSVNRSLGAVAAKNVVSQLAEVKTALDSLENSVRQTVHVHLTSSQKSALLKFFEKHYYKSDQLPESDQLHIGLRWFLQYALPHIVSISKTADRLVDYRNAEGFPDDVAFTDGLISEALNGWGK